MSEADQKRFIITTDLEGYNLLKDLFRKGAIHRTSYHRNRQKPITQSLERYREAGNTFKIKEFEGKLADCQDQIAYWRELADLGLEESGLFTIEN